MPFHPRIEFALNRVAILGSMATDELAVIVNDENAAMFEKMLAISVTSITDPAKFQTFLRQEEATQLKAKLALLEQQQHEQQQRLSDAQENSSPSSSLSTDNQALVAHLQQRLSSLQQPQLEIGAGTHMSTASRVVRIGDEDDENNLRGEEHDDEDEEIETEEEKEARSIELEAQRMKKELKSMSMLLLDSLSISIEQMKAKKTKTESGIASNNNDEKEEVEEEPPVRVSNASLLRFVMTVLCDTAVATALRVPLLQGDLPLLTRSVLRCCMAPVDSTAAAVASSSSAGLSSEERRVIIFMTLDMLATMCADSAACRLSFACCVPVVASLLRGFVVGAAPLPKKKAIAGDAPAAAVVSVAAPVQRKPPPKFVRPASAAASASASSTTTSAGPVVPPLPTTTTCTATTTNDDVIFAGAAALETMLFHCVEAIEAFVAADGIRVLVRLYKQLSAEALKKEQLLAQLGEEDMKKQNAKASAAGGATETTAFIKRVLIHIRCCGVLGESAWDSMLGKAKSSKQPTQAATGDVNKENTEITPPALAAVCTVDVFGRQGDDIAVDELRWALSGALHLGKIAKK